RMIESGEEFCLAFEVLDSLRPCALVRKHLDHFLDGDKAIGKVLILGEVDRSHSAAAEPAKDLVSISEQGARCKLNTHWSVSGSGHTGTCGPSRRGRCEDFRTCDFLQRTTLTAEWITGGRERSAFGTKWHNRRM